MDHFTRAGSLSIWNRLVMAKTSLKIRQVLSSTERPVLRVEKNWKGDLYLLGPELGDVIRVCSPSTSTTKTSHGYGVWRLSVSAPVILETGPPRS